jgi:putative transposase
MEEMVDCWMSIGGVPGMQSARLKVPADRPVGYYHCLSRVFDRRFVLHEAEKDQFVSLMREHESFCEVVVITKSVVVKGTGPAS